MGRTTSHPVRNPTLILQRNAKKRCSNLAELGGHLGPRPQARASHPTSWWHLFVPKTYFADGEHPCSTRLEAPRDNVKRGTSPRTGHKTAVEGCAEQRGCLSRG